MGKEDEQSARADEDLTLEVRLKGVNDSPDLGLEVVNGVLQGIGVVGRVVTHAGFSAEI